MTAPATFVASATLQNPDGSTPTGTVVFTPSSRSTPSSTVVPAKPITVAINGSGQVIETLVAGVAYYVQENITGQTTPAPYTLPSQSASVATTVASGSNGVNVSTFTGTQSLAVASSASFSSGFVTVATSSGTAIIAYGGTSAGNLTNCTLVSGAGTLATGGAVTSAVDLSTVSVSTGLVVNPGAYQGTWSSTVVYQPNQIVSYNNGLWTALLPSVNSAPANGNSNWSAIIPSGAYVQVVNERLNVKQPPSSVNGGVGAKGDGSTNDNTAVQAALAAANAAAPNAAVYFPPGNYVGLQRLKPAVGVSILGDSAGATNLDFSSVTNDHAITAAANNSYAVFQGFKITLAAAGSVGSCTDAWIDAISKASPAGYVIGISPGAFAQNCVLRDLYIVGGTASVVLGADKGTKLFGVSMYTPRNHCLVIDSAPGAANAFNTITGEGLFLSNANGGGHAGASDYTGVSNVYIYSSTGNVPARITLQGHFDEPIATAAVNSDNIRVVDGIDVTITDSTVNVPVGAAGSTRYGIYIGADTKRTMLRNVRIEPYDPVADGTRVPTNTILIASGAANTVLEDVSTNRNTGGDISDSGTATVWRNVSLSGVGPINVGATKAGVPSDADYDVAPPVGTQVLDTTDGKIYYRTAAATWKAATLA